MLITYYNCIQIPSSGMYLDGVDKEICTHWYGIFPVGTSFQVFYNEVCIQV